MCEGKISPETWERYRFDKMIQNWTVISPNYAHKLMNAPYDSRRTINYYYPRGKLAQPPDTHYVVSQYTKNSACL